MNTDPHRNAKSANYIVAAAKLHLILEFKKHKAEYKEYSNATERNAPTLIYLK